MSAFEQKLREEFIIREIEKRHESERGSLKEFIKSYWEKEKKENLVDNWHIDLICEKLEKVFNGEIKRLIINIPPRTLKTEIVSKAFAVRGMGNRPSLKVMAISYSSDLAEKNSGGARDMYLSETYRSIFPRRPQLRDDQNTKQHWINADGGHYYAAGSTGTITGVGADIIIIDDPLKPTEANSQLVRSSVNNNFHDTIRSRLNEPTEGAIIVIMQRLHDDDLCGHLMELERNGTGEKWDKLIIPAIAEADEEYRKRGESFFPARFPREEVLEVIKSADKQVFASQYQQNPVNKDTQEFHEEWFRYFDIAPVHGRIFTACDPAFTQKLESDNTCIITGCFHEDKLYLLEYSVGKYTPDEMISKLIYHIRKWQPEKVGIEAVQAQRFIGANLRNELARQGLHALIEDIIQTGDKVSKIRKLVYYYSRGLIFHKRETMDELENELKRFPKGKHDDIIDAEQMLYHLYELQPHVERMNSPIVDYDMYGNPIGVRI